MTASDDTPGEGESPSTAQTADWESLGRVLLVEALEYRGDRLRSAWVEITSKAKKGEAVTRRDWVRLDRELRQFSHVADELEEATREEE